MPRRSARAGTVAPRARTPYYAITETADQRGLELCSALRAYAIAVGLCDGLVEAGRAEAMYNTKSLIYTQAVAEIARLGRTGARPETVYGLGGAGDLHVTGWPGATASSASCAGRVVHAHVVRRSGAGPAHRGLCRHPLVLALRRGRGGGVPLLRALHRIVYGGRDVERELRAACCTPNHWRSPMRRTLAGMLAAGLLAGARPRRRRPIIAQFWYSFGGKNREVTEAHIKKFNESQTKYRIEGTFQGDYFQALAKIRAAAATKTAPAVFHVVGEAMPELWQAGCSTAGCLRGGAQRDQPGRLLPGRPSTPTSTIWASRSRRPSRCRSSAARPSSTTTRRCWRPRASRCPAPGTNSAPPPTSSPCARGPRSRCTASRCRWTGGSGTPCSTRPAAA